MNYKRGVNWEGDGNKREVELHRRPFHHHQKTSPLGKVLELETVVVVGVHFAIVETRGLVVGA